MVIAVNQTGLLLHTLTYLSFSFFRAALLPSPITALSGFFLKNGVKAKGMFILVVCPLCYCGTGVVQTGSSPSK
jgi:hypothetical protein